MNLQIQKPKYDLEERTAKFGEAVIVLSRRLKADHISGPLITQLIKASTSIGANYMEANGAESKRDFIHKIGIAKKEAKETKHFLRMIAKSNPESLIESRKLWQEAQELSLIFGAITKKKLV